METLSVAVATTSAHVVTSFGVTSSAAVVTSIAGVSSAAVVTSFVAAVT